MAAQRVDAVAVSARSKNLDIETLRAFAVLLTMVSHLDILFFWNPNGLAWLKKTFGLWVGVDLFFAISGFVIARGLYEQLSKAADYESKARVICSFWARRAYRILPTSVLWIVIGITLTIVFNQSKAFGDLRGNVLDAAAALVQFADLHYYQCIGPGQGPDTCGITRLFGPYWSLSLEEKFYLLLPILMIFTGKRLRLVIIIVAIVQILTPRKQLELLWWFRTDAFLIGVLIALERGSILHKVFEPKFIKSSIFLRPVSLVIVCCMILITSPLQVFPIHTGMLAILCGLLVWIASYDDGYLIGSGCARNFAAWLGSRSYAIYMIHVPAYALTKEIWFRMAGSNAHIDGTYTLRFSITSILLIMVFSEINFRWIETPLRQKGAGVAKRVLTTRLLAT